MEEKNYISPWINYSQFDWSHLTKNSISMMIRKENILYRQGDISEYVYIIKEGRMELFFIDKFGNENSICIAEEGSILGEVSVIDNLPNYVSARATANTLLYKIRKVDFLNCVSKNILIANYVIKNILIKLRLMNSKMEYLRRNALSRVSISLISLCVQYGVPYEGKLKINYKFTHQELANLTYLHRVTVSKIFKDLRNKKIISKRRNSIIINDVFQLTKFIKF